VITASKESMDKQLQFISASQEKRPDIVAELQELGELYSRKLWHQLTVKLEQLIEDDRVQRDGFLIALYQNFIAGFAHKINLLNLSFFAVTVAKQMPPQVSVITIHQITPTATLLPSPPFPPTSSHPPSLPLLQDGLAFINDVISNLEASNAPGSTQPILFLRMQAAQYHQLLGNLSDTKSMLDQGRTTLDSLTDADPAVSGSVHYVSMQIAKETQAYADFYRSSLQYLAFISYETLTEEMRVSLAVDISLSALMGEDIYNFGELLLHPILNTLRENKSYIWLLEILECFDAGDIHAYDALCSKHAAALNAQPALVAHERKLREKVTIAALLEMIGSLPAEARSLALVDIAAKTKLPVEGVELLLMRALALHLIEGVVDGVSGSVAITWVAPRVLTYRQVEGMAGRLEGWVSRVDSAAITLQDEAAGLLVSQA
jgi:26S proteasome regulatory subunit N9